MASTDSSPSVLGTTVMAGLGGPIGGGIYAGVKDNSFLTGLAALLAAGGGAFYGRNLAGAGARAALGKFAPMVAKGLRSGEKLVTPGASTWQKILRYAPAVGAGAGSIAGTAGISTLASKEASSNISTTMPAIFYALHRHEKIASQRKEAGLGLALRGGAQLARRALPTAGRMIKNVTPLAERGVSSAVRGMVPAGRQIVNMGAGGGGGALGNALSRFGQWSAANPRLSGALAGGGAVAGYEGLYGRPKTKLEGARLGAQGTAMQMSQAMANAPLMQRLGFLFNPSGSADAMQQAALQQILAQLG